MTSSGMWTRAGQRTKEVFQPGDIDGNVPEKTKIWSDNQGAIQLAKNPVFHSRTKHIGVHYNITKDKFATMMGLLPKSMIDRRFCHFRSSEAQTFA